MDSETTQEFCLTESELLLPSLALASARVEQDSDLPSAHDISRLETLSPDAASDDKSVESLVLIDFNDFNITFAVDVGIQLIDAPAIYRLPNVNRNFAGIINLRGDFVPVIDLYKMLVIRTSKAKMSKVLLFGKNEKTVGLLVNKLPEIINVARASIETANQLKNDNEITIPALLKSSVVGFYELKNLPTLNNIPVNNNDIFRIDTEAFASNLLAASLTV